MAYGKEHDAVQADCGEWDNESAAMRQLDRAADEVRCLIACQVPIHDVEDELDQRERCNGK